MTPSLTGLLRFRADFNESIRREIFTDVTLHFSVFVSSSGDQPPLGDVGS